ncbi:restriction endonuclease [Mucilaginibacter angelicae]|uniref:Restriction endonuclease n=1 Tax=Mucilaginibacter angelicae TaxID=869718 RepID=A0ABV6L4U0_9SPHI
MVKLKISPVFTVNAHVEGDQLFGSIVDFQNAPDMNGDRVSVRKISAFDIPSSQDVLLLGATGAGKTSLIKSLLFRTVNSDAQRTLFIANKIKFSEGGTVKFADLRGDATDEEYVSILSASNAQIVLIVIDSQMQDPEKSCINWLSLLKRHHKNYDGLLKILITTKADGGNEVRLSPGFEDRTAIKHHFSVSSATGFGLDGLRATLSTAFKEFLKIDDDSEVSIIIRTCVDKLCYAILKEARNLKRLDWIDMERIIAQILEELGFDVILTAPAKDGGKDVVVNCRIGDKNHTFFIEIKHWRTTKPGMSYLSDFVAVNFLEGTSGGIFLSSSGFAKNVYNQIWELSKQRVRLGDREKILSLCKRYVEKKNGVRCEVQPLHELLFEDLID